MSADPAGLLLPVPEQEEDLTRQWLDRRFRQVRPARPGSAVVLVRDGDDGPEVFLRHRAGRTPLGRVGLPGGALIESDADSCPWYGPEPSQWARTFGTTDRRRARQHVVAAVRELHDEAGVLLAGRSDTDVDRQELETLAAAVKPLTTWHALDTLQEAREACGGAGFLAENRVAQMRADLDVYVTFEGDNTVLLQLVGKRLLTDYSKEFGRLNVGAVSRYVVHQASDAIHRAGLHKVVQSVADGGSERERGRAGRDQGEDDLVRGVGEGGQGVRRRHGQRPPPVHAGLVGGVRRHGATEEAAAQEGGQRGHRTTVPPPGPGTAATRMLPDVPAGCEDGARVGSPAHGAPHERQGRAWPTT